MAFFRCDVMSESLGMATSVLVTMPDTGDLAAAPVVYLLHGLTDNCTGWLRYTQAEHLARTHGAILIVPEVQRSFYTDMACGPKYFTYINQELPTLCRRFFGIQPVPERTYIMGLSMGGYGAMKCAFTAPQQYAGCAGFSSVAEILPLKDGLVESEEIVKEVIDVFASFSETADPDEERSWVSENPFADENKPAEE